MEGNSGNPPLHLSFYALRFQVRRPSVINGMRHGINQKNAVQFNPMFANPPYRETHTPIEIKNRK